MIGEMALGKHEFVYENMEFNIFSNGSKRIPNHIMCGGVFSPMNTTK
jgi:hypothetical protein